MIGSSRQRNRYSAVVVYLALATCVFLLSSCNKEQAAGSAEPVKIAPEPSLSDKKAELVSQINRKFENPDAHYELGRLYHSVGNWDEAEHEYSIALSFDPVHRKAQAAIVKVLLDGGDKIGSEAAANKYIGQASNSAGGSLRLAHAFLREALDKYAATCFKQAVALEPGSAATNRELGYYYLAKADKDAAKRYLSESFRIDPKQPQLAIDLGRLGVETRIPEKNKSKPEVETKN